MSGSRFLFDSLYCIEGTLSPNDKVCLFNLILDMKGLYSIISTWLSQRYLVLVIHPQTTSSTLLFHLVPDPILTPVIPPCHSHHLCSRVTYILFLTIWELSIRKV